MGRPPGQSTPTSSRTTRCCGRWRARALTNEASGILGLMQAKGVRANEATYTIVLDHALGHGGGGGGDGDLPERQVRMVERVFADMRRSGLDVNMQTYAKVIHAFLRQPGPAPPRSPSRPCWPTSGPRASSCRPTSTPCWPTTTSRARRPDLDRRAPPHRDAQAGDSEKLGIDRIFWERVVRGFALAGRRRIRPRLLRQDRPLAVRHLGHARGPAARPDRRPPPRRRRRPRRPRPRHARCSAPRTPWAPTPGTGSTASGTSPSSTTCLRPPCPGNTRRQTPGSLLCVANGNHSYTTRTPSTYIGTLLRTHTHTHTLIHL